MSDTLEALLRLIARAAPQSWHPRLHAERQGLAPDAFDDYLEHLYLDGLLEKGEGSEQTGPGVVLTAKGRQLLEDRGALQRLREGKAIDPRDRGGIVRELLRGSFRPVVTWLLLAANFAVFGYGLYLAGKGRIQSTFLGYFPVGDQHVPPDVMARFSAILEASGAFKGDYLMAGQWWRLLSSCFVHIGLLHLLMNMYMLFVLGKQVEQMYGRWRYLLLYLLAGLGGSCLVAAYGVGTEVEVAVKEKKDQEVQIVKVVQWTRTAGASGALCGLLGAEAVWMFLNRRYLPRSVVRRWRGGFLLTVVLLVFISLFPGVSGLGHLGGALVGAVVGFLLNYQRFGPSPWRWLTLVAVLLLPWGGYALIEHARATNPIWLKLEGKEYDSLRLVGRTRAVERKATEWYQDQFKPLLRRDEDHWKDRDPKEAQEVLTREARPLEDLTRLAADLRKALRAFRSPAIVEELEVLQEYTGEWIKQLDMARKLLTDKQQLTPEDREALKTREKKLAELRPDWK